MQNKIRELIQEIVNLPKKKRHIVRKNIYPIVKGAHNTLWENNSLCSINNNAMVFMELPEEGKHFKVVSQIKAENNSLLTQLFYKSKGDKGFSEENSIWLGKADGKLKVNYINTSKCIKELRLDPINGNGKFSIEYFEIIKISKLEYLLLREIFFIKQIIKKVKSNPVYIKKFIHLVKKEGLLYAISKVKLKITNGGNKYQYKEPIFTGSMREEIRNFPYKPLISIIMPVYNVTPTWLDLAIKSVERQWYDNWELCIVDDASTNKRIKGYLENISNPKVKVKLLAENQGISGASNEALKMAEGEFVAFLDHDDELTPDALYEVVKLINKKRGEVDFIYSDEDFVEGENKYVNPHFKPDYSPDLLLSHNYITHLSVIRRDLILNVGGFDHRKDGAQDYDLYLKVVENTRKIYHIPKVLYHWRVHGSSSTLNEESKSRYSLAGKMALEDALKRRKIDGEVSEVNLPCYYKVSYRLIGRPLISIIIPFKDNPEILRECIESVVNKSTYSNYEIIGISNNSSRKETYEEMERLEKMDERVKFHEYNVPFNYSKINNYAVFNLAHGEHIVLMNSDIQIITPEWIEEMLMFSQREDVGAVGAKLYYPDNTIQHAGIIVGLGGYAAHSHRGVSGRSYGYFNRLNVVQNVSAVTAALMMLKKEIYERVNGMDEENFKIAYNDVDLCLRIFKRGYWNIFTPFARAYHYESKTRGDDNKDESKRRRFDQEKRSLLEIHGEFIKRGDPFYNPNLTLSKEDFSLKVTA